MSIGVIGPFIGVCRNNCLNIIIALPFKEHVDKLNCVFKGDNHQKEVSSDVVDDNYRNFVFAVPEEFRGQEVNYRFEIDDVPLDLEGAMTDSDCKFTYDLSFSSENDYFVLLSCNNPFLAHEDKGTGAPWAMWDKLAEHTDCNHCKLILLGGDQVYCDDLERGKCDAPSAPWLTEQHRPTLRNDFINQYLKYWGNLSLRRALASTPSLAMWDDHDITDGWGSRGEMLDSNGDLKDSWRIYFEEANGAFKAYQAIRNPEPISPATKFSTCADFGTTRFYLADFRSERNASEKLLWSQGHEIDCLAHIENTDEETESIYFLSPVIGLRTNFETDRKATVVSRTLHALAQYRKRNPILYTWGGGGPMILVFFLGLVLLFTRGETVAPRFAIKDNLSVSIENASAFYAIAFVLSFFVFAATSLKWWLKASVAFLIVLIATGFLLMKIDNVAVSLASVLLIVLSSTVLLFQACFGKYIVRGELSGISDDLDDALSSDANIASFKKILKALFTQSIKKKRCVILSGDIHTGGISEFVMQQGDQVYQIPQIVSSPIGYAPMPKAVEGFTTTTSEMNYRSEDMDIKGRNLFYFCRRNFAKIYPKRTNRDVEFFFEGHSWSFVVNSSFIPSE